MSTFKKHRRIYWPLIPSILLLIVATLHRSMIDDVERYRTSLLGTIGILLALFLMITLLGLLIYAFIKLVKQQWGTAAHTSLVFILTFILMYMGMAIDAPTILYAT